MKNENVRIGFLGAALIFLGFVLQAAAGADVVRKAPFKEDLSIGVKTGDARYMFGGRIFIGVDDAGAIYVSDTDASRIQKFSPEGKYLMTIGGPGQGPGEIGNARAPRFDADGNLYVTDVIKDAIVFFDRTGHYLKKISSLPRISDSHITPDGHVVGAQGRMNFVNGKPPELITVYGLYESSGRVMTEFFRETFTLPPPPTKSSLKTDPNASRLCDALQPLSFLTMGRDGWIYFGNSAAYRIDVYSPQGRKLRAITRDIPLGKIETGDVDLLAESMFGGDSAKVTREALKLKDFPKIKPAFRRLAPLDDGGLAVVVDIAGKDLTLIDLFDPAGKFLERVEAAIPYQGLLFKNGKAYAVKIDAEGYSYVKRYAYSWK